MKINYELPYNEWLFELVKKILCALGFAVYYRGKNCAKPAAVINEYMYCKSDLLVYHEHHVEGLVETNVHCAHISLCHLSLDEQDEDDQYSIKGAVTELKVKSNDIDVTVENECFYNMFDEAAKLTLNLLCKDLDCSECHDVWDSGVST